MRISFDLDDTLILKTVEGPTEPALPALKRNYFEERLRRGAKDLICTLDDSLELEAEARRHGFNMVRVGADDPAWVSTVTGAIERILKTGHAA
jgi:hypothetical protein